VHSFNNITCSFKKTRLYSSTTMLYKIKIWTIISMLKQYCCTPPFIVFCPHPFTLNLKVFYIVHKVYVFHLNMNVTNLHNCTFNFTSTFVWSKCIPLIANMNAITMASDTNSNRHQSIFLTPQSYLCYMDRNL